MAHRAQNLVYTNNDDDDDWDVLREDYLHIFGCLIMVPYTQLLDLYDCSISDWKRPLVTWRSIREAFSAALVRLSIISRYYIAKRLVQWQYVLSNLPWNFDKSAYTQGLNASFVNIMLAPRIDVTICWRVPSWWKHPLPRISHNAEGEHGTQKSKEQCESHITRLNVLVQMAKA